MSFALLPRSLAESIALCPNLFTYSSVQILFMIYTSIMPYTPCSSACHSIESNESIYSGSERKLGMLFTRC